MTEWDLSETVRNGSLVKGYYVNFPTRKPTESTCNGYLVNREGEGSALRLWINNWEVNFQQGGSFAQSMVKRDWYGRNLQQPRIRVSGQVANSADYQKLGEFVRRTHIHALRTNAQSADQQEIQLVLKEGGIKVLGKRHAKWSVFGYIDRIARGAERFINAPTWTFDFIISYAESTPLFKDGGRATGSELESILGITRRQFNKDEAYIEPDPDTESDEVVFSLWGNEEKLKFEPMEDLAIPWGPNKGIPIEKPEDEDPFFENEQWPSGAPRYDKGGNPIDAEGNPLKRYP